MIHFQLVLILTAIKFCVATAVATDGQEEDYFVCYIDFNIYVSRDGQFCDGSETINGSTPQIHFQYKTAIEDWQPLISYNTSMEAVELNFTLNVPAAMHIQFRWVQNITKQSPPWAIDDVSIDCSLISSMANAYFFRSISFEETPDDLRSLLECHSGQITQATKNCSNTQFSLVMNGTEREVRTSIFNLSNSVDPRSRNLIFNTCKECHMEVLFDTVVSWPASYVNTQLTLPCVISDANATRTCNSNGVWEPSQLELYDYCRIKNTSVCLGPSISHGLVWSTTPVNDTASIRCSQISELFWSSINATRKCMDGGRWDKKVNLSQCTMKSRRSFLVRYSTRLSIAGPNYSNSSQIKNELQRLLELDNVEVTVVLYPVADLFQNYSLLLATFVGEQLSDGLMNTGAFKRQVPPPSHMLVDTIAENVSGNYGHFNTFREAQFVLSEIIKMSPDDICQCDGSNINYNITNESRLQIVEAYVCVGPPFPPCVYGNGSMCNRPYYAGNNITCGRDADQDGLPDVNLRCEQIACRQDGCTSISNTPTSDTDSQDLTFCMPEIVDCQNMTDPEFGLAWPGARKNFTVIRVCPDGTGDAARLCNSDGIWKVPDVKNCSSFVYQELAKEVNFTVADIGHGNAMELTNRILINLANLVAPSQYSIFPLDIQTALDVFAKILDIAEIVPDILQLEEFDNISVGIHSDLLEDKNGPGFEQLIEINRTENQKLILNSERLGILLANSISSRTVVKNNIVMSVERRGLSNSTTVVFPQPDQLSNYNNTMVNVINNFIQIPEGFIQRRLQNANTVPISNIIFNNLDKFLPRTQDLSYPDDNSKGVPASVIISSQVGNSSLPMVSGDDHIVLEFNHSAGSYSPNDRNLRCGFWNFSLEQAGGPGGWDVRNVEVIDKNSSIIRCNSSHLTCFAVLVDISTVNLTKGEATALSVVTYVGCGISLTCLLGAIILLLVFRKALLKEIHNFAHLNLAVALFLAVTVYVAGIETATNHKVACTVVAALLHYLFTAVFSWMLCEGILLFVLLVQVFSFKFLQKKWFYFALGWGIPIPIVAISVAIAHDYYGNENFCWISTNKGAIWAFIGPMLLIILINTVFLVLVLKVLFKSKSQHLSGEPGKQMNIAKSLMKAIVVLLPLLGLTWTFGLLTVNERLSVFIWLFTVLNSLQGLFIFIFHVLRIKKVQKIIKNTALFKSVKCLFSAKGHVTFIQTAKNNRRTLIKVNGEVYNGIIQPLSQKDQNDGHQAETNGTLLSHDVLDSNCVTTSNKVLCTAV